MGKRKKLLAGIDVGSTKICTCIGLNEGNNLRVLGTGWAPSKGLKKGVVVNLTETINSVKQSLELAESEAKLVVESASVSVGGNYLRSVNSVGETDIRGKHGRVSAEDVARVIDAAQKAELPKEFEIIHALTQNFSVDNQVEIIDPIGLAGKQLSVNLHLVMNASAVVENIVSSINKAGVVVDRVVMQQLASAEAVLTEDEKELGSVLVDIGGGTTDISVYSKGTIWHSEVLPMGGNLITKDIAIGLKAPLEEAEEVKRTLGSVYPDEVPEEEILEIGQIGTGRKRTITRRLLCQIVEARCEEILETIAQVVRKVGIKKNLVTGVILTGGGSLQQGLIHRAEEILDLPIRLGEPYGFITRDQSILNPAYSTALGLLKHSVSMSNESLTNALKPNLLNKPKATTERLKNWILDKIG